MSSDSCEPVLISHGFQMNYERGFSNGLASLGMRPLLICSDRVDAVGTDPAVTLLNLRGSQEESRPKWRKAANLLRYNLALAWELARRRSRVVHMIGMVVPVPVNGLAHGLWCRLWSKRYVLTVHDLPPEGTSVLGRLGYRWTYRLPDAIVVHTRRTAQALVHEHGVPPQRITVVEHGIEPPSAAAPPPELPNQRAPGPFRLLAFGRIAGYKGLDVLVESLHQMKEPVSLTVCGHCTDEAYAQELRTALARLPDHVQWQWRNEYIREAEVPDYFLQADALVLPYRRIDQSGVLFQALRYGLPIVATDVGEFSRYIKPAIGEVVPKIDDPRGLADAIQRLMHRFDHISRQAIAAEGRRFHWPEVLRDMKRDVYGM